MGNDPWAEVDPPRPASELIKSRARTGSNCTEPEPESIVARALSLEDRPTLAEGWTPRCPAEERARLNSEVEPARRLVELSFTPPHTQVTRMFPRKIEKPKTPRNPKTGTSYEDFSEAVAPQHKGSGGGLRCRRIRLNFGGLEQPTPAPYV